MSHQAASWARHDAPMLLTEKGKPDTTARAILGELAEHADENGCNSWPSVLHMAYATGYDERTVQRALRRLEAAGLIVRAGTYRGCTRWRLDLSKVRPASDWADMEAAAEAAKEAETDARAARRRQSALALSGTQNAGHIDEPPPMSGTENPGQATDPGRPPDDVRHAESRRPAFKVPASGTQNPGVRHAVPPEPSLNLQEPSGTFTGGTLPPDPLRPEDPTASGSSEREEIAIYEPDDQRRDVIANHRPRARGRAPTLDDDLRPSGAALARLVLAGRIRVEDLPDFTDDHMAEVIPIRSRSA
jgi:DNA-binding transcriptional ArsR family regulator